MTAGRHTEPSVKSSNWTVDPCGASSWACGVNELGLTDILNVFGAQEKEGPKQERSKSTRLVDVDRYSNVMDETEMHEVTLKEHMERTFVPKSNKEMVGPEYHVHNEKPVVGEDAKENAKPNKKPVQVPQPAKANIETAQKGTTLNIEPKKKIEERRHESEKQERAGKIDSNRSLPEKNVQQEQAKPPAEQQRVPNNKSTASSGKARVVQDTNKQNLQRQISAEEQRLKRQEETEKRMQKAREQQKKRLMQKEAAEKQKRLEESKAKHSSKKRSIPQKQEAPRASKHSTAQQAKTMQTRSAQWKAEQEAKAAAQRQEWEKNWHAQQQRQQQHNKQYYSAGGSQVPPPPQHAASPPVPSHQHWHQAAVAGHQWHSTSHPPQQQQQPRSFVKQAPPPFYTSSPPGVQQAPGYKPGIPIPQHQQASSVPTHHGQFAKNNWDGHQQGRSQPYSHGVPPPVSGTTPTGGPPPASQYRQPPPTKTTPSTSRPSPAQTSSQARASQQNPAAPTASKYANVTNKSTNQQDQSAVIKRNLLTSWALQSPMLQSLRRIEELVTTLHTVLPPAFGVASHGYFSKWKPISRQSLSSTGSPICDDEKLKKAVRKIRFFLHPDKLPKDLSETQSFVCTMLWDIISDAWETHQSHK